MSDSLPDQLRQWHAQFSAGEVYFARIMVEIDAAIAAARSTHDPNTIVWLMQCWMLRQLYLTIISETNETIGDLLIKLGALPEAMLIAQVAPTSVQKFRTLARIYHLAQPKYLPALTQLYAGLEPLGEPDMTHYAYPLIRAYLDERQYEAAIQLARLTGEDNFCRTLREVISICMAEHQHAQAEHYLYWLKESLTVSDQQRGKNWQASSLWQLEWAKLAGSLAMTLALVGSHPQAKRLFQQTEQTMQRARKDRQHSKFDEEEAQFHVGLCYLAAGNWRKASHWLNHCEGNPRRSKAKPPDFDLRRMLRLLASYTQPEALIGFYDRLRPAYHTSPLSVALIRQLLALGAQDQVQHMLRPFFNAAGEPDNDILDVLDRLGETALVERRVMAMVDAIVEDNKESPFADPSFEYFLFDFLVTPRRYALLEQVLHIPDLPYAFRFSLVLDWVQECMTNGDWERARRIVAEWITPSPDAATAEAWYTGQFKVLCGAVELMAAEDPNQARAWLDAAWQNFHTHFTPIPADYETLAEACLAVGAMARLETLLHHMLHRDASAATTHSHALHRLVEQALAHDDPATARRVMAFILAHQRVRNCALWARPARDMLEEPLQSPQSGRQLEYTLPSWRDLPRNLTPDDFAVAVLQSQADFDALEPGLHRRILRACLDVLALVEQSQEQPA